MENFSKQESDEIDNAFRLLTDRGVMLWETKGSKICAVVHCSVSKSSETTTLEINEKSFPKAEPHVVYTAVQNQLKHYNKQQKAAS